jgi:hypothetical protein
MSRNVCPCGCAVKLNGRQKAASVACRKRLSRCKGKQQLSRALGKAQAQKVSWPALVTVAARLGSEQRPAMLYYGLMNIPCWYTADRAYVEVVIGDNEVADALQRVAACVGGYHLPSTGLIHGYLLPTEALVAMMVRAQEKRESRYKRAA